MPGQRLIRCYNQFVTHGQRYDKVWNGHLVIRELVSL